MAHHEPAHSHAPAHPPVLHGTADDEYAYTPEGSTYEHTDANVWVIAKFGIWLAITAVVVHFGIGVLYGALVEQAKDALEGGRFSDAAAQLQELRRNGGGALVGLTAWLTTHAPQAALAAYRLRGLRPRWLRA